FKAADWGDVNQAGTVSQGINANILGLSVATLENGSGTNSYCNANGAAASTSASASTQYCRSRYGAADMVGSVAEWTTGQIYNGAGYDTGPAGLWLGQSLLTSTNPISSFGDYYDLLHAYPASSGKPTIADNGDSYWYASGLMGASRGGAWNTGTADGRWA